jgi:hypothetical protein
MVISHTEVREGRMGRDTKVRMRMQMRTWRRLRCVGTVLSSGFYAANVFLCSVGCFGNVILCIPCVGKMLTCACSVTVDSVDVLLDKTFARLRCHCWWCCCCC